MTFQLHNECKIFEPRFKNMPLLSGKTRAYLSQCPLFQTYAWLVHSTRTPNVE